MSMGSEYLAEFEYERDEEIKRMESLYIQASLEASRGIWRTKDGKVLSVHEMETSHIRNCMKMLHRNHSPFEEVYAEIFETELAERKES